MFLTIPPHLGKDQSKHMKVQSHPCKYTPISRRLLAAESSVIVSKPIFPHWKNTV